MRVNSKIGRFVLTLPKSSLDQSESLNWIASKHSEDTLSHERLSKLFHRYGVESHKISRRSFEVPDQIKDSPPESHLFPSGQPTKGMGAKMHFFKKRSFEVFEELYELSPSCVAPEHMIHVTCTGYVSPSPAQAFVDAKGWQVPITNAYHMGCYASLPALRMADAFLQNSEKKTGVDIIHTEMCSLHMDTASNNPEQIVVQSLFVDGHIKYTVMNEDHATESGFRILGIKESLLPKTTEMMTWIPMDWGIAMTLSREVPMQIRDHIRPFVENLCKESGLDLGMVLKHGIFAIHPGGPKIIDGVQEALELSEAQCRASREVLFERGNMSSATLPHVWEKLSRENLKKGQVVISLAFGPGLTVFGAAFIYE